MGHFRTAVAATSKASYNYSTGNAWAGVLYAGALYEIGDFDHAEQMAGVYLPLAIDVGVPDHIITGHMIRVRVPFYRGDPGKAFETLTTLEYLGHHRQLPRVVASAKLERGRLLLLQGHGQAAKEELDRADDPEVWERARRQWLPAHSVDWMPIARLRWEIHFGDARSTLAPLEREIAEATRQTRHRRALRLRVLHSLALQRSGEPAAATDVIAGVLRLAAQEGFVRLIADEGDAVGRLIQRFLAVLQEAPARNSDPALLAYLQRLLGAFGSLAASASPSAQGDQLMEPLTRKEIQVLQRVAEGASNTGIAEKLDLSINTVRAHLRSINNKLNARSRAEAVAIARRLDLIR
jgi:LuxR family maltose regulon positive regulatory protein